MGGVPPAHLGGQRSEVRSQKSEVGGRKICFYVVLMTPIWQGESPPPTWIRNLLFNDGYNLILAGGTAPLGGALSR